VASTASDVLEGYGVFRVTTQIYHTYVLSSAGDAWGCHGWATGGSLVCSAAGSASFARCIEGGDDAGIYYMRTGVCHQIANRILSAAGIEIPISAHTQVRASHLVYGKFGRNYQWVPTSRRWPDRQAANVGASSESASSSSGLSKGISLSMSQPLSNDDFFESRQELSALVKAGLGHPVDDATLTALANMQARLQDRIGELGGLLLEHRISRPRYIEELNRVLSDASSMGERILGFEDFHKVFGDLSADQLGDPAVFLADQDGSGR